MIVDDVITAGTSVRESVELIRAQGATPGCADLPRPHGKGRAEVSAVEEVESVYANPVGWRSHAGGPDALHRRPAECGSTRWRWRRTCALRGRGATSGHGRRPMNGARVKSIPVTLETRSFAGRRASDARIRAPASRSCYAAASLIAASGLAQAATTNGWTTRECVLQRQDPPRGHQKGNVGARQERRAGEAHDPALTADQRRKILETRRAPSSSPRTASSVDRRERACGHVHRRRRDRPCAPARASTIEQRSSRPPRHTGQLNKRKTESTSAGPHSATRQYLPCSARDCHLDAELSAGRARDRKEREIVMVNARYDADKKRWRECGRPPRRRWRRAGSGQQIGRRANGPEVAQPTLKESAGRRSTQGTPSRLR